MSSGTAIGAVEFAAEDGTILRGDLHRPSFDGDAPAVVMSHGFSAVRSMALPDYAAVLVEAGFAVLVYDHRNLGESDGTPRQEINPWAQSRDMRDAIGWLGAQPGIDPTRIGLWGSSFSGGEALVVAAVDERVRAVAANVPFAGLAVDGYDDTGSAFASIAAQLTSQPSLADPGGRVVGPLAVVTEDGDDRPVFLDQPESADWFLSAGAASGTWRNEVTLRNAFGSDPAFDPGVVVGQLHTPLLMVVASEDRVADVAIARATFERATDPKRLVTIDGHHFSPYSGHALTVAAEAARDFFAEHL